MDNRKSPAQNLARKKVRDHSRMREKRQIPGPTQQVVDWRQQGFAVPCTTIGPFLALGLLALLGCGPRSDRLAISGSVKLDGTPLDGGSIRFTSLSAEKKLASGAMVQNGEYNIPQEKGLTPGTYHVEISAPDNAAPPIMVRATPGGPGIPTQPERIPPEYNVDSKQTIEVTADGDNHFDFDIVSRRKSRLNHDSWSDRSNTRS